MMRHANLRRRSLLAAGGAGLLAGTGVARAQAGFPNRPVKVLIPFGPGGATDNVARIISGPLSEELGQQVVIDNKPGAAGNIALDMAAKAPADGYTLLMGNVSTNAINPWIYAGQLKSDPLKDLVPISLVASVPGVFSSSAKFAPNTLAELVAYAKAHPGEVNHASAGAGSYAMIDMLAFERAAGLKMVHVPFKGGAGQYVVSMIANEVQISFTNASSVLELTRAGKLKALAVTGDKRIAELPDVPTMAEAGFKGIGTSGWQGLFAPANTPPAAVRRLHAAVQKALARDSVKESFAKMIIGSGGSASPEEFAGFVRTDAARWKKLVDDFRIVVD